MTATVLVSGSNHVGIRIGHCEYFFSYLTCVAYRDLERNIAVRRESNFSHTTARHLKEMGVYSWQRVDDLTFEQLMEVKQ